MNEQAATTIEANDWLREQARRRLLSLLDVAPLVSRYDPPGAAHSHRAVPPVEVTPASAGGNAPVKSLSAELRASQPAVAQRAESRAGIAATSGSTAAPAIAVTSAAAGTRAERNAVSFSLLMVSAGAWLWVESLPDRLLRQAQINLVTAMASAISGPDTKANYRQFDWPITDNPHLARDLETGRESVAGLLMRMQREVKARGVILMGDAVGEFCPIPSGLVQHSIPSTLTMLEHPRRKMDAWQTLRPLVQSATPVSPSL